MLVGIGTGDVDYDSKWLASKLLALKLFPELEEEPWGWKKGVAEAGGEVLCGEFVVRPLTARARSAVLTSRRDALSPVSQFTLMANTKKGSKPDFHGAMVSYKLKREGVEALSRLADLPRLAFRPARRARGCMRSSCATSERSMHRKRSTTDA